MNRFLKTRRTDVALDGRPVRLRGVNLGGWLMMEGYILHAPNEPVHLFKERFRRAHGRRGLRDFERAFRDNFVRREDFQRIADWGFNCVRLPFHHLLVERRPYVYDPDGVAYLDRALRYARGCGLWVILDLHAACGCQNHDWHSDSAGKAGLWRSRAFQDRTVAFWEFLADRYKENATVAGYDLLNEPVVGDVARLRRFYHRLVKAVRRTDPHHMFFVEGDRWAQDVDGLEDIPDDNTALSIHFYQPLEFTFRFVPGLSYPLKSASGRFDGKSIRRAMQLYRDKARRCGRPVLVGEFGVNARGGHDGEQAWVADALAAFEACGFHWTYWTYKAVKNAVFPDGIMSYRPNPPWVRREGPRWGWDNYAACWKDRRAVMVRSWRTGAFDINTEILRVLRKAV